MPRPRTKSDPEDDAGPVRHFTWKGVISFGLVEIPVGLRSAESRSELKLSFLDRRDFAPVGYERYNKTTGKPVPWEEIVRGYEHEDGEFVILSDEDLKRANVRASQTIEIVSFAASSDIDPIYLDTPYYVLPLKKGSKSYALLRDTLENSSKVGIAHYVMRTRGHVAVLTAREHVLLLQNLRYQTEVVPVSSLHLTKEDLEAEISDRERKVAERLVQGMTARFKPQEHHDAYHDDLLALIQKRVKTGQTKMSSEPAVEAPTSGSRIVDLLPLLEKSVDAVGGARAKATRAKGKPASARTNRAPARTRRA